MEHAQLSHFEMSASGLLLPLLSVGAVDDSVWVIFLHRVI
jgi:hypothetical protein